MTKSQRRPSESNSQGDCGEANENSQGAGPMGKVTVMPTSLVVPGGLDQDISISMSEGQLDNFQ